MTRDRLIAEQISKEWGYPVELVKDMIFNVYSLEAFSKDASKVCREDMACRYKENMLHLQKKYDCTESSLIAIKLLIDSNKDYQKYFGYLTDEV
jgi:hypothetical protein